MTWKKPHIGKQTVVSGDIFGQMQVNTYGFGDGDCWKCTKVSKSKVDDELIKHHIDLFNKNPDFNKAACEVYREHTGDELTPTVLDSLSWNDKGDIFLFASSKMYHQLHGES